jgi:hypothetical protein
MKYIAKPAEVRHCPPLGERVPVSTPEKLNPDKTFRNAENPGFLINHKGQLKTKPRA